MTKERWKKQADWEGVTLTRWIERNCDRVLRGHEPGPRANVSEIIHETKKPKSKLCPHGLPLGYDCKGCQGQGKSRM